MTIPPKPVFHPELAPIGVEVKFVLFDRPKMTVKPRLQLVHTNAAGGEGTIASAWNWAHAKPNSNTIPHYQIDRSGAARKMLPTDRIGIANCTSAPKAQVRNWSLAYETADRGTNHPEGIGGFTQPQGETLAQILAYESITHGIPLRYPTTWDGSGTASHTEPFYWSCTVGKVCPGAEKKQQLVSWVLPRAWEIAAAWTAEPAPPPPPAPTPQPNLQENDDMTFIAQRPDGGVALVSHGGAGVVATWVDGATPYLHGGVPLIQVTNADFDRLFAAAEASTVRTVTLNG